MKTGLFLPALAAVTVCLAGWVGFRMTSAREVARGASEPGRESRNRVLPPRLRMESADSLSPRGAIGKTAGMESRAELRAFVAAEDNGELTVESMEEADGILARAIEWSRRELIAAAEEMMEEDLSTPRRAHLFGGLLNLLSTKDGVRALDLYDRAWESAGFNRNGGFFVHEMVMNLADHNPERAVEWVRERRERLPKEMSRILLEKIDGGSPE